MTKYLSIPILFAIFLITSCGNNGKKEDRVTNLAIDSVKFLEQDSLITVQVELINNIDTLKLPGNCGYFCQVLPLDFKVIKVLSGKYDLPIIPIYILCPREKITNKEIQNNKTYTYSLKRTKAGQELYCVVAKNNLAYYILYK